MSSKEKQWFIGTLRGRGGYEAWMTHLAKGLQDPDFLLRFEATSDPWERSKLVGQEISELRRSFKAMSNEQRAELARQAEVELKTGLELLGRDKKTIQDLIALVDRTSEEPSSPPLFFCGARVTCKIFRRRRNGERATRKVNLTG